MIELDDECEMVTKAICRLGWIKESNWHDKWTLYWCACECVTVVKFTLSVCVCVCTGFMFHAASAGYIPQGFACSANLNSIWPRLLLCYESACPSVHGPVFVTPTLYITLERK